MLMRAQPASEDDQFAKSVLYVKYVRGLAHALSFARSQGLPLLTDLLAGVREVAGVHTVAHQTLFRQAPVLCVVSKRLIEHSQSLSLLTDLLAGIWEVAGVHTVAHQTPFRQALGSDYGLDLP